MANPNLASITSVTAQAVSYSLNAGSGSTVIINNSASSGSLIQILSFTTRPKGATPCDLYIRYHVQDDGGGGWDDLLNPSATWITPQTNGLTGALFKLNECLYVPEDKSIAAYLPAGTDGWYIYIQYQLFS